MTIVNYNKEVPSAVSHVTFAHEVGHNFGSQVKGISKFCVFLKTHKKRPILDYKYSLEPSKYPLTSGGQRAGPLGVVDRVSDSRARCPEFFHSSLR